MSTLHARVLLDTGPNAAELDEVRQLFADAGLTVEVEGHSYGGPPPTSMFLIVVNVPMLAILEQFAADGSTGAANLRTLLARLLLIRADARRWGRPHVLKLEDTHGRLSVICPPDLPLEACAKLLTLDLSPFDRGSPSITCAWHGEAGGWLARIEGQSRPVWRVLPVRSGPARPEAARPVDAAEFGELWRLVQSPATPLVTWQRANVVLHSALGWNVSSTAAKTLLSPERIRAILKAFNGAGFAALSSTFDDIPPPRVTEQSLETARRIAATPPARLGLGMSMWDATSLGEYLVRSAVVEDATDSWVLTTVLDRHRVAA